jgi:hypothetical protein
MRALDLQRQSGAVRALAFCSLRCVAQIEFALCRSRRAEGEVLEGGGAVARFRATRSSSARVSQLAPRLIPLQA